MTPEQVLSHPARVLDDEQRRAFFADGYLSLSGWLDRAAAAALRGALADLAEIARERPASDADFTLAPGHSAEQPRLVTIRRVHDMHPRFWRYVSRSRLPDLAADLVGPDVKFRESYLNLKRAHDGEAVSWHQDFPFFPMTNRAMITTLTYLDDVTPEMGPIAVVPGSHRGELFDHHDGAGAWTGRLAERDEDRAGIARARVQAGPAGTVVVFDSCTLHGSAPNTTARDRPVLVAGFAAADAFPYTATPPSMHSPRTWRILRGRPAVFAHHEAVKVRLPPDWSQTAYIAPDWPEGTNAGMGAADRTKGAMR